MIKLRVLKNYNDVKLNKSMKSGDVFETDKDRALELLGNALNLVEVLEISKLSGKNNEAVVSTKKRK